MAQPAVTRRAMVCASAAALCALASRRAVADVERPAKADEERSIFRKLRYRADSGPLFWWVKGPHYAQVGAALTPLYGALFGSIQRVTQNADGGFSVRDLEFNFKTDIDTGKRLDNFRNPITNQTVPVALTMPHPATITYSTDNVLHVPPMYGRSHIAVDHYPERSFVAGKTLFLRDRSRAVLTAPSERTRIVNELSTFSAPAAQVLDPSVMSADTVLQSNDVSDWPAWLKMGEQPGAMVLIGAGAKVASLADMPADWLEMLQASAPDVARDPMAALERGRAG